MNKSGRPSRDEAVKHPLHGHFNGDVPWIDGCKEYGKSTCLECPVSLEECPAENPRLHKGGRTKGSKNKQDPSLSEP